MRTLGAVSGLLAGAGGAVLLQQFAVLPASSSWLLAFPLVGALLGLAAGWPSRGHGDAAAEAVGPAPGDVDGVPLGEPLAEGPR